MRKINPYKYHGSLLSCGSKSHAQRILILGVLSKSDVFIENFIEESVGTDVKHVMGVCRQLGFEFKQESNGIQMMPPESIQIAPEPSFSIGESGFALRTLSTVLSNYTDSYILEGKNTILSRDHRGLIKSLRSLGFLIISKENKLPISISKNTKLPSLIDIDGSEGSQFTSGLLMCALALESDTEIRVKQLTSRPYIDLTIETIKQFNGVVRNKMNSTFLIPGNQKLKASNVILEGDWSNMSFHLVGAALHGEIKISGLNTSSSQADKIILDVLKKFGAIIDVEKTNGIKVSSASKNPFQIDLTDAPDLFPVLSVLACGANGLSTLTGIQRLINKESNRLESICEMLEVFKVSFYYEGNSLNIVGSGIVHGGHIKTYNDHRMAMAAICAGTIAKNEISIDDEECINKSYKNYFKQLDSILNYEA